MPFLQSNTNTHTGSIMFHVRRRPADSQPRRRKKKPLGVSNGGNSVSLDREGPTLVEITHSGDGGRRVKLSAEPIEVRGIITHIYFQRVSNIVVVGFHRSAQRTPISCSCSGRPFSRVIA